jgi:hypothetical protein
LCASDAQRACSRAILSLLNLRDYDISHLRTYSNTRHRSLCERANRGTDRFIAHSHTPCIIEIICLPSRKVCTVCPCSLPCQRSGPVLMYLCNSAHVILTHTISRTDASRQDAPQHEHLRLQRHFFAAAASRAVRPARATASARRGGQAALQAKEFGGEGGGVCYSIWAMRRPQWARVWDISSRQVLTTPTEIQSPLPCTCTPPRLRRPSGTFPTNPIRWQGPSLCGCALCTANRPA